MLDPQYRNALSTADSIVTVFEAALDGEPPEEAGDTALDMLAEFDAASLQVMVLHLAERLAEWTA